MGNREFIRRVRGLLIVIGILPLCLACQNNYEKPYAKLEPSQVRKIPVHFQSAPNICGPAALLSICEFYGIETTEQQIATLAGTTPTGTSLYGLARAADSLGLKANGAYVTAYVLRRKQVQFDGSYSDGDNLTYYWTFGDGGSSSEWTPLHRYTFPGTYTVTLTVTNSGGSAQDTMTVEVMDPYVVKVDFTGSGEHTMQDSQGIITDPIWDSTVVEPYSSHTGGDKDKPAVYTRHSTPTVKGKVWCENNLSQSTPIHIDTLGPHSMDFDADGGSVQNGISAYFTLPSSNGGNDQFKNFVYKYSSYQLQWKYRIDGDDVWMSTMNNTAHVIYLTLSMPLSPMAQPWEPALDKACEWASQDTTANSVVEHLVESAYSSSGKTYDGTQTHAPGTTFHLTVFLASNYADCRDMSAWFHVLTTALGVGTQVKRISYNAGSFNYKDILAVGDTIWDNGSWNFHQVGWYNSKVYDSTLKYDTNPPNEEGEVPVNMSIDGDYKYGLYESGTWDSSEAPFSYTVID